MQIIEPGRANPRINKKKLKLGVAKQRLYSRTLLTEH